MYQTSEQCAQQFKTMTGLPQVQKALELIEELKALVERT